ncbi:MAG TPA: phosphatidate cytidylyltransferase, partial [Gemmatimonadaceae bacterium]|nr:phosphatidate cytidylyltransferase [Gemmatimonadaceae bacterium]
MPIDWTMTQGVGWMLLLFVITWAADIFAFLVGSAVKGPKLWPRFSPNKTWSGFFGGLAGAMGAAVVFAALTPLELDALAAALVGLLVWGEPFRYWVIDVLGSRGVSPLRSAQHLLASWVYVAGALLAALALIRGPSWRVLLAAWVVWLVLFTTEAYTSGIAWMLNHLGPGSLIAAVWIATALTTLATDLGGGLEERSPEAWVRAAGVAVVGVLLPAGIDAARLPTRVFGDDATRYVTAIEREMADDPARTLLDVGSWVYLRDGIVMKDRAATIGDRGYAATGDFSGMIRRLDERRYRKILVRGFAADDSWYDEPFWHVRSGIRAALERNYVEVGRIPAVQTLENGAGMRYLFREVSILVPRPP